MLGSLSIISCPKLALFGASRYRQHSRRRPARANESCLVAFSPFSRRLLSVLQMRGDGRDRRISLSLNTMIVLTGRVMTCNCIMKKEQRKRC